MRFEGGLYCILSGFSFLLQEWGGEMCEEMWEKYGRL